MKLFQRLLDFRWLLVVALFAVLPLTIHGALQAWRSNSNRIEDWIRPDEQLTRFVSLFGSDELLMISWDGCTLGDPRIDAYARELTRPVVDAGAYYRAVVTGPGWARILGGVGR